MLKRKQIIIYSCIFLGLQACGDESLPLQSDEVSPTPTFTSATVGFEADNLNDYRFGIDNCKVYKLKGGAATNPKWELLFKPAPYALPQQCVRERLDFDGEYIQIEIGTQALGAGGCCTTYAAYRSRDGENWEIRPATTITKWQVLERNE